MAQVIITTENLPSTSQGKDAKLIRFAGQLDESNVDERAKEIYEIINSSTSSLFLIFDFEQLEYMNSKSIGYLTDWYTKLSEKNGGIVIAAAPANILDILNVVGISQLIKCVPSVDEAKLTLMQQQS